MVWDGLHVKVNSYSKVVLTGSFLPEKFKDSDADFNIGTALGSLLVAPTVTMCHYRPSITLFLPFLFSLMT